MNRGTSKAGCCLCPVFPLSRIPILIYLLSAQVVATGVMMSAAKHCHERACSRQATSPVETGLVVGGAANERRAVSCPPWQDLQQASDVVVCREPVTCPRRSYAVRWGIDLAKEKLGPRGRRRPGAMAGRIIIYNLVDSPE